MWKVYEKTDLTAVAQMDRFVRDHEKGHFMQLPCWADAKSRWDWRGICVYREGALAATMGILIRRLPLGLTLFYAPRGPVCDRDDTKIWTDLAEAIRICAREHRAILVYMDPDELDTNDTFRKIVKALGFKETEDTGFGNIQPQYVFRLDLTPGEDAILKGFSAKTRYNIGLARRKGVTVREYSGSQSVPESLLENFYELMETTGQRDRFRIRDLNYFRELLGALRDDSRILVAYLQDVPIAGAIQVFCGKKAWYLYGASSNEHRNVMPNYLLQWTMIRAALERGCEMYDFRGVPGALSAETPLYGLYRFKKGFGGTYTKFTGLFTLTVRPACGLVLKMATKLRRVVFGIRKE